MAIYYISVQIIGRSAGRTATGAAAYRAGERIHDERTGQTFDYTRRQGEIETEIHPPQGAPEWASDRSRLWNAAEAAERRGDAQVAREIVVAFPKELNPDEQRQLIREYVQSQFVSQGMAADVAIHRNPGNPHAHVMLTMRELGPEGFAAKKNREWNRPEALERWREEWANHSNRALERAGREERIDHRSHQEQGLDRLPQVHLGPHAAVLERQGVPTERGDHNRMVAEHNGVVVELDRVREEKRKLEVERVTQERYVGRVQAGWLPDHAKALADLESRAGGTELTQPALQEQYKATEEELSKVRGEMGAINREGNDLWHARRALKEHEQAQVQLRTHQAPLAAVKRVFSPTARAAYREAQDRVQATGNALKPWGIRTEAEWGERMDRLAKRQDRLPGLEARADFLGGSLRAIEKALEGFNRAADRARAARMREQQARDESILRQLQRNIERERNRGGWDRGR